MLVAREDWRTLIPQLQQRPVVGNWLSWKAAAELVIIVLCCWDLLLGFQGF